MNNTKGSEIKEIMLFKVIEKRKVLVKIYIYILKICVGFLNKSTKIACKCNNWIKRRNFHAASCRITMPSSRI